MKPFNAHRIRMFVRLVAGALWGRRERTATAWLALTIGSATVFALGSLFSEMTTRLRDELRPLGPNMLVTPGQPEAQALLQPEEIAETCSLVAAQPGAIAVPFRHTVARLDRGEAVVTGVDLPALSRLYPYWQIVGDWVTVSFDERHGLVGRALADDLGIVLGEAVTVRFSPGQPEVRCTVAGVFESGTAYDQQLLLPAAVVDRALSDAGTAHGVEVRWPGDRAAVDAFAATLAQAEPSLVARPITNLSPGETVVFTRTRSLMALVVVVILLLTTLDVAVTLLAAIRERQAEFALYAALGAARRRVVTLLTAEATVLGLGGGATGIFLGAGLAQLLSYSLFGLGLTLSPAMSGFTLGLALASAVLGSLLPLRQATSTETAATLRGL